MKWGFLVDVQSCFSPLDIKVSSLGLFWLQVTETQLARVHIEFIGFGEGEDMGETKNWRSSYLLAPVLCLAHSGYSEIFVELMYGLSYRTQGL